MGVVFRAQRCDGTFEQTVAIKLIPAPITGELAQAMFDRERRHLAKLEHPNIARIIDAGVTDDGVPYYVMEFIDGIAIDESLKDKPRRVVLAFFLSLCDAVAYCHRSMIVHGDIKPANVLVADQRVRLLDFGIGRLIEETDGMESRKRLRAYSPGFASPEQMTGEPIGVASDIYSLGALLSRLLASSRGPKQSRDLQAIAAKCMRQQPGERYSSVEALQSDLRNHLSHLPVAARKPSRLYQARKFVRRNAVLTTAASFVVAALSIGLGLALWQYQAARTEAERSRQVTGFLTSLFERADPYVSGERDATLREVVDDAAVRIDTELSQLPDVQSEVKSLIGDAYYGIGEFDKAFELHREALAYWTDREKRPHIEIVRALNALGNDYRERGDYETAIKLHRDAIAQLEAMNLANSLDAWESWTRLGASLKELQPIEGTNASLRAHEINLALRPGDKAAIARSLGQIASGFRAQDKIEESAQYHELALEVADANDERLAPDIISIRCNLALDYGTLGRYGEAYDEQRLCIDLATTRLGRRHPWRVYYLSNLGALDLRLGRLAEAEESYLEAISIAEEKLPPKSIGRLAAEINYASVLWQSGRGHQAARNLGDILGRMEESYGGQHASSQRVRSLLGRVMLSQGHAGEAEELIVDSLSGLTGAWRSDALLWLAEAKLARGEREAAADHARESLLLRQSDAKYPKWQIAEAEGALGQATANEELIAKASRIFREALPPNHFRRQD